MKYIFHSLLFFCLLFFCGCEKHITPKGKYIEAEVIVKAEKEFPVGLLKISNIYPVEDDMEMPSRAVIYKYDEHNPLDLKQVVYIKIVCKNDIQLAEVYNGIPEFGKIKVREAHRIINLIDFNLHNGDIHREGPKHKKLHHESRKPSYPLILNRYYRIIFKDPEDNTDDTLKIAPPLPGNIFDAGIEEYFIALSRSGAVDTNNIYTLELEHIHD
jgi:hypothetical protein